MNLYFFIVLVVAAFLLSGCTQVTIQSNGGVSTHWAWGFPVITIVADEHATIVKTTSLGLAQSPHTFNIGYLDEVFLVSGKACELVLFEPSTNNVSALERLINLNQSICTTVGELNHENKKSIRD